MNRIDELRAQAPDLARAVKGRLMGCLGRERRQTKEQLAVAILGRYTSSTDRQIRDAVAQLQEMGELIVADLEDGGYYYAASEEEAQRYLADIQSRVDKLVLKRNAMYQRMRELFGSAVPKGQRSLF